MPAGKEISGTWQHREFNANNIMEHLFIKFRIAYCLCELRVGKAVILAAIFFFILLMKEFTEYKSFLLKICRIVDRQCQILL